MWRNISLSSHMYIKNNNKKLKIIIKEKKKWSNKEMKLFGLLYIDDIYGVVVGFNGIDFDLKVLFEVG